MRSDGQQPSLEEAPRQPAGGPSPEIPRLSLRTRTAALALLIGATSLAVGTVSPWLVPPYLVLMAWLLLVPAQPEEAEDKPVVEEDPVEQNQDAEAESDGPAGMDPTSKLTKGEAHKAPSKGPQQPNQPNAGAPGVAPVATKAEAPARPPRRRGGRRGRKAAAAAPVNVKWVRVGPGQFIRVEEPAKPPAESQPREEDESSPKVDTPEEPASNPTVVETQVDPPPKSPTIGEELLLPLGINEAEVNPPSDQPAEETRSAAAVEKENEPEPASPTSGEPSPDDSEISIAQVDASLSANPSSEPTGSAEPAEHESTEVEDAPIEATEGPDVGIAMEPADALSVGNDLPQAGETEGKGEDSAAPAAEEPIESFLPTPEFDGESPVALETSNRAAEPASAPIPEHLPTVETVPQSIVAVTIANSDQPRHRRRPRSSGRSWQTARSHGRRPSLRVCRPSRVRGRPDRGPRSSTSRLSRARTTLEARAPPPERPLRMARQPSNMSARNPIQRPRRKPKPLLPKRPSRVRETSALELAE